MNETSSKRTHQEQLEVKKSIVNDYAFCMSVAPRTGLIDPNKTIEPVRTSPGGSHEHRRRVRASHWFEVKHPDQNESLVKCRLVDVFFPLTSLVNFRLIQSDITTDRTVWLEDVVRITRNGLVLSPIPEKNEYGNRLFVGANDAQLDLAKLAIETCVNHTTQMLRAPENQR